MLEFDKIYSLLRCTFGLNLMALMGRSCAYPLIVNGILGISMKVGMKPTTVKSCIRRRIKTKYDS